MSDYLVDLGQNPHARQIIKRLGLPIPVPQKLRRADGPRQVRPLHDSTIVVGAADGSTLAAVIARTITMAGANPHVASDRVLEDFRAVGEAYGRPAVVLDLSDLAPPFRADALIFDASGIAEPGQLRALYEFFHPLAGAIAACGRVVVLGRPAHAQSSAAASAAQAALEGFVRSLAKEIGNKGATAQTVYVESGAEARLSGVLRFLLSSRSVFVNGQPIVVTREAADVEADALIAPLAGKVALLTGAARGIGAATAGLLAAEGAHVVCLDRPEDAAAVSQLARKIAGSVLLTDVTDADAPKRIADELRELHGGVDIIIHNAGVTRDKTIARMKGEHWDQAIDINLGAVARITDALLDGVLRDGGRIICLSSVAGIAGNMGQTNYAASKAGIIGLVKHLGRSLATRGITVNAIAPGFIETRLTAAIPMVVREGGRRLSNMGQGGLPEDVGQAITFLATPDSQGITGSVLRVCGGAFIGA